MEKGPKNGFEPGQSIDTGAEGSNYSPETQEFLEANPGLKKEIAESTAKLEDLQSGEAEAGGIEGGERPKINERFRAILNRNEKVQAGERKHLKKTTKGIIIIAAVAAVIIGVAGIYNYTHPKTENNATETVVDVDQGDGEVLSNTIHSHSYDDEIEVDIDPGEYEGDSKFRTDEKYHFGPSLVVEQTEGMSKSEKVKLELEDFLDRQDEPTLNTMSSVIFGTEIEGLNLGRDNRIDSTPEMTRLANAMLENGDLRQDVYERNRQAWADLLEQSNVQEYTLEAGTRYNSFDEIVVPYEDGHEELRIGVNNSDIIASEDATVLRILSQEDGQNLLDVNEIGSAKYNILKAAGKIPNNISDEEALAIMAEYEVLGIKLDCGGQIVYVRIGKNPDNPVPPGPEPGPEPEPETPDTPPSNPNPPTSYDGKTNIIVENPYDTQLGLTPDSGVPLSEASDTSVNDGGNGYVNDHQPGESAQVADESFFAGSGSGDADGGGSHNETTEAHYDADTSGWNTSARPEEGTQNLGGQENAGDNDSQANGASAGENTTTQEDQAAYDTMSDRF